VQGKPDDIFVQVDVQKPVWQVDSYANHARAGQIVSVIISTHFSPLA
jgi:hypothetical protein